MKKTIQTIRLVVKHKWQVELYSHSTWILKLSIHHWNFLRLVTLVSSEMHTIQSRINKHYKTQPKIITIYQKKTVWFMIETLKCWCNYGKLWRKCLINSTEYIYYILLTRRTEYTKLTTYYPKELQQKYPVNFLKEIINFFLEIRYEIGVTTNLNVTDVALILHIDISTD